jgi:hypothetical protein
MQRRMFGSRREKVMGGWRVLHNEKFHNMFSSQDLKTLLGLSNHGG